MTMSSAGRAISTAARLPGWFANVASMGITLVFWYAQPPGSLHPFVFAVYLVAKNVYVATRSGWFRGATYISG